MTERDDDDKKTLRRNWTVCKYRLDWTEREIKIVMTGRDGIQFLPRREMTVLPFLSTARGGIFMFSRLDGTVRIIFHCTGERNAKRTNLGTKQAVLQVTSYKLHGIILRRMISYDIIRALLMGVNL